MAAPIKQFADYFPHGANERGEKRALALRRTYGLEGFAVHCMMQETLTGEPGYKWHWENDLALEILAGDLQIDPKRLEEILRYMAKIKLYSYENNYYWSDDLIANFNSLMERRRQQREAKAKKAKKGKLADENQNCNDENNQVVRENPENDGKSATTSQQKGRVFICSDQVGGENSHIDQNRSDQDQIRKEKKKKDQSKSDPRGKPDENAGVTTESDRTASGLQGERTSSETEETRWQRQRAELFRQIAPRLGVDIRNSRPEVQDKLLADQRTICGLLDEIYAAKWGKGTRFSIITEHLLRLANLAGGPAIENPMGYWIKTCRTEILGQAT
jgi:hypothetical protein